jgi:voltage-gated potassium channel
MERRRPIARSNQCLRPARGWRHRCYEVLEPGGFSDWVSRLVDAVIILLVAISLTTVALESVHALAARYGGIFRAVELVALVVFSLEYALRIWTAVEHSLYRPCRRRRRGCDMRPALRALSI